MSGKEASSDSRDSGKQSLDRNDYPYFTHDQFTTFSEDGKDFVEKVHSSNKKLHEIRLAKYSLEHHELKQLENDLKIVLCGKTGCGKSSTANSILGEEVFAASRSSNSVTKVSLDNTCKYKNRKITVVDTPGIHDTKSANDTIVKELKRIAFLLKDGVHCFVICMSAGDTRFTQEVKDTLKHIEQKGQGNFYDYCMLAYTKAETELETCSLREFLEKKKENVGNRDFLEQINDRVVAVNNKSLLPAEELRNRDALIEMVDVVVSENRQKRNPVMFTNELFKAAGNLHAKLASVVHRNDFHQSLINATIEVIVNNSTSSLAFDDYLEEVVEIVKKRESSEAKDKILDFFNPKTQTVNEKFRNQVKQIYDEIQSEVKTFTEKITPYVLAAAATTTAAVGVFAGAGAAAVAAAGGAAVLAAGAIIGVLFEKSPKK